MSLLIILLIIAAVLLFVLKRSRNETVVHENKECRKGGGCCGGVNCHKHHADKEEIRMRSITYFDDEELDRLAGKDPKSYTIEEEAEFVAIWNTLQPLERNEWLASLERRGVALPSALLPKVAEHKQSLL